MAQIDGWMKGSSCSEGEFVHESLECCVFQRMTKLCLLFSWMAKDFDGQSRTDGCTVLADKGWFWFGLWKRKRERERERENPSDYKSVAMN